MGRQPDGAVCAHRWTGTQRQRRPPLPTWAGFKLAAEREEETILYRYLSPCFPFVTTPSLCKTEKHTGALQGLLEPTHRAGAGASLAEGRAQTTCHFPKLGQMQKRKAQGTARLCFPARSQPLQGGMLLQTGCLQVGGPAGPPSLSLRPCGAAQALLPGASIINAQGSESEMCGERETKLPRWLPLRSPLALRDSPVLFRFKLLMSQSPGLTERWLSALPTLIHSCGSYTGSQERRRPFLFFSHGENS